MRLNFETEYFAISYHNMQPSFDLITVSHKKQKDRRTKTTWKARELTSPFLWLLLSRKETGNRRVSAATFIKSSHTEHAQTKCPSALPYKKLKKLPTLLLTG